MKMMVLFFVFLLSLAQVEGLSYLQVQTSQKGVRYLHREPDVVEVFNLLEKQECEALIAKAESIGLTESPVAYAGWSSDLSDLLGLWVRGPAVWMGLLAAWGLGTHDRVQAALVAVGVFAFSSTLAWALATGWTLGYKRSSLKNLRTSKSVAISGEAWDTSSLSSKAQQKVYSWLSNTLEIPADCMESLTLIRYEPGEKLAPHFDANRDYASEDSDRGGQTLATCLFYLTNSEANNGGATTFTSLNLRIQPKLGDACLFFPAAIDGTPDQRLEHAGEPPLQDTKWIARIWVHQRPVPSPFGLHPDNLSLLSSYSQQKDLAAEKRSLAR